jgi:hypothetical protein
LFLTHQGHNEEGHEAVVPYLYKLWAIKGVSTPGDKNYDPIIAGKSSFLNTGFFLGRLIAFLGCYAIFGNLLIKYSKMRMRLAA